MIKNQGPHHATLANRYLANNNHENHDLTDKVLSHIFQESWLH